jgi:hypothetical protein
VKEEKAEKTPKKEKKEEKAEKTPKAEKKEEKTEKTPKSAKKEDKAEKTPKKEKKEEKAEKTPKKAEKTPKKEPTEDGDESKSAKVWCPVSRGPFFSIWCGRSKNGPRLNLTFNDLNFTNNACWRPGFYPSSFPSTASRGIPVWSRYS